jgi:aminoglycoside N3'-acetyltransferase
MTGGDKASNPNLRQLSSVVRDEFTGALPSWVIERIEKKVRDRQANEPRRRKSLTRAGRRSADR